jgi:hypothetical protein
MRWSVDMTMADNPSAVCVWIEKNGGSAALKPGLTVVKA